MKRDTVGSRREGTRKMMRFLKWIRTVRMEKMLKILKILRPREMTERS